MDIQQARQLAQDEITAPEILTELGTHDDYLTRQYVAANPNTPAEILLSICWEFPNEVMKNPVIPLLLLENPYLLTCKIPWNFNEIKRLTDLEMKRLSITKVQARQYLLQHYGKRSRLQLTDMQLHDFLYRLKFMSVNNLPTVSIKSTSANSNPTVSNQSTQQPWDEIPF